MSLIHLAGVTVIAPLCSPDDGRRHYYLLARCIHAAILDGHGRDTRRYRAVPLLMKDARWPAAEGWVKMAQVINGVNIHYVRNAITGFLDDFKFTL